MPRQAASVRAEPSREPLVPALAISGLDLSFPNREGGTLQVLSGITLEVAADSIHAIVGRSGCGKSTLLNVVAGLIPPDGGEVRIGGVPSTRFDDWARIGYVFQDDRLLPWRTALGNIAFALENLEIGRKEREARARDMLALVGLSAFEKAFPNELSGGMRSRVALARSLVRRPRILLMDEPFSRLDAQTRETMHRELVRLRDHLGMTVLFVTHDVEEAVVLADRVTVLAPRPGRVIAEIEMPALPRPRDGTAPEMARTIRHLKTLLGGDGAPPVAEPHAAL